MPKKGTPTTPKTTNEVPTKYTKILEYSDWAAFVTHKNFEA